MNTVCETYRRPDDGRQRCLRNGNLKIQFGNGPPGGSQCRKTKAHDDLKQCQLIIMMPSENGLLAVNFLPLADS